MKLLAWLLAPILVVAVGVPLGAVAITAAVVAPAVAEQIRIDPCSAYPDQTNVAVSGGEEDGVGFELPKWGSPRHQSLTSPAQTIPAGVKKLYLAAATKYLVPWELLAGIGMAETRHGRNNQTSSAGAQGLMQFMPRTFSAYGVDGNHDGRRDIHNDADSIYSAANYLVESGLTRGAQGVLKALWAYNHSISYRNDVLYYSWSFEGRGGSILVAGRLRRRHRRRQPRPAAAYLRAGGKHVRLGFQAKGQALCLGRDRAARLRLFRIRRCRVPPDRHPAPAHRRIHAAVGPQERLPRAPLPGPPRRSGVHQYLARPP